MVVPAVGDAEIANCLQRILQSTGWFEMPRVSVRDGVVSLDGRTGTQEHRNWAGVLAENVQGTVAIVNRIEVHADVRSTFGRAGDEFASLYRQALQAWPLVALAVVIIVVTWLIAKLVTILARRFFSTRIASPLLLGVVVRAFSFPIFILGFYFVLQFSGLTRLAITVLGGTGLIGIIVGFAFRDIAENFLASILLSVRNPFRSGELIEVGGHTGIVQNLNIRTTVLLTLDGNHVQIPNATVFKSTIKNYSSTPNRRAEFTVGIGYDLSTIKAQTLIAKVRRHPAVLDAPELLVLVEELGAATGTCASTIGSTAPLIPRLRSTLPFYASPRTCCSRAGSNCLIRRARWSFRRAYQSSIWKAPKNRNSRPKATPVRLPLRRKRPLPRLARATCPMR